MSKLKFKWVKIIKKQDDVKLIYYSTTCPRCKRELRVHQLGQRRVSEGLHVLNCQNDMQ